MIALIFRLAIFGLILYGVYRAVQWLLGEAFSDTKRCPRCEGKGWWQNTRSRDKCEWCKGSGRLPKNYPV
ncbi:MAG: hypothetical protein AAFQ87_23935 [Bacteroidota bacterium]